LLSGTLINGGHISGGVGGYGNVFTGAASSGVGVELWAGSVTNNGSIAGGAGHAGLLGDLGGPGGAGGVGVQVLSGTLTNNSQISGGNGGAGGEGEFINGGNGGAGGAGVDLSSGSVINTGSITGGTGGAGGSGYYPNYFGGTGGSGGAGVYLNGGTLSTSGSISGGAGAAGGYPDGSSGSNGDAVQFGPVASTLVVQPHALFNGLVAANASVDDTLKLSGTQSGGTPITLGAQFLDFSTLTFAAGAAWTVQAGAGAAPSGGLAIDGFAAGDRIDITNLTPTQVAAQFNPTTHTLSTAGDGTLKFAGSFTDEYFTFTGDGGSGTELSVVKGSEISTTITSTVTVGSAAHPSPLTITASGLIAPTNAGASGVVSAIKGNVLTNNGTIHGAAGKNGSAGGVGGIGLDVEKAATLTNTGNITGGAGGSGSAGAGGAGGAGVVLNGGTLSTSGTISGGAGGAGSTAGAAGKAVTFGTVPSTLKVDSGAVFHGAIGGFAIGDTVDITNLTPTQVTADFNTSTHVLTTGVDGTLSFAGAFTNEHFVFTAAGSGTDVTLAKGAASSFESLSHDAMNFVSDYHLALTEGRMMPMHGLGSSLLTTAGAAASDHTSYGFASHEFTDHGLAHLPLDVCKA
jgi:hypothetical protein